MVFIRVLVIPGAQKPATNLTFADGFLRGLKDFGVLAQDHLCLSPSGGLSWPKAQDY